MYDSIKVKQDLPLPKDLKSLKINWKDYTFQTKNLENCLLDYFISEEGFLYEHIVDKEYIPYSEEERKLKKISPWNLWKEVIEKGSRNEKMDFHGTLKFYTYDQLDEDTDFWIDFQAYFVYGKLDKIKLIDFSIDKDRRVQNEKWKEEYKKKQKHPWNVFKKYASYVGWRWFWRKASSFFYHLSGTCGSVQYFIIKHFL